MLLGLVMELLLRNPLSHVDFLLCDVGHEALRQVSPVVKLSAGRVLLEQQQQQLNWMAGAWFEEEALVLQRRWWSFLVERLWDQ